MLHLFAKFLVSEVVAGDVTNRLPMVTNAQEVHHSIRCDPCKLHITTFALLVDLEAIVEDEDADIRQSDFVRAFVLHRLTRR
jgi:hypothetical protein